MTFNKDMELMKKLYSNRFKCPKCSAAVQIPSATPGQQELFAPLCYSCGAQMVPDGLT